LLPPPVKNARAGRNAGLDKTQGRAAPAPARFGGRNIPAGPDNKIKPNYSQNIKNFPRRGNLRLPSMKPMRETGSSRIRGGFSSGDRYFGSKI
jgi:hypothetical protein